MTEKNTTILDADLHMPVAVGTEMLVEVSGRQTRIRGELIGMEAGKYFIMKFAPKDLEGVNPDALKENVVVRYLHRGSVYGFKAQVLNVITSPALLAFFNYPKKIEGFNIRSNPRFECILPAMAVCREREYQGVIIDISREGCRCVIKVSIFDNKEVLYSAIDVDSGIEVITKLPGIEEDVVFKGLIKNVSKDEDRITFGALFENTDPETARRLNDYIALISDVRRSRP